ncbi:DUF1329 domain-containing protein [Parathalassolituus penaei]|uniref:DUF1329 domain-containing protein n=1 Tax=Parathalassolituus penaei TaxID=2997323 RepID=A0A9X3EFN8_9GAMM|nr:DUF1329 domain-containing protein [Parathalassolituus penaei]MCY0966401.1 DUF1329 domain-containing protein [Parathalassolituus penaei]
MRWSASLWPDMRVYLASLLASFFLLAGVQAQDMPSGVSAHLDGGQHLLSQLTPLAANPAGNGVDIPPWRGGVRMPPPAAAAGSERVSPYESDQSILVINGDNWQQYRQFLATGLQSLFQQNPDFFEISVYPTRRSAAAPDAVYDAIYRNAVRVQMDRGLLYGQFAQGGIIFPLAQTGQELVWNHLSRWRGYGRTAVVEDWQPSASGWRRLRWQLDEKIPFYSHLHRPQATEPIFTRDLVANGFSMSEIANTRSGVKRDERGAYPAEWQANFPASEDRDMFSANPADYVWTLLGSREMYVPYNQNLQQLPELIPGRHPSMAHVRFEKHRVRLVDGVLRKGAHGLYQKRVFYIDEDSSAILMADLYDGDGHLWRFNLALPVCWYELPAVVSVAELSIDLLAGSYAAIGWPVTGESPKWLVLEQ